MNIRLWRVLLFVLIIIGSTVLIYPFPRDMVELYLEGGEVSKATDLIDQLLEEDPDDLELLTVASDVYLVRGLPDKAIASLNRVLEHKPRDRAVLEKLVQVYEWNVMPTEAMRTWERIAAILVNEEQPLKKLVMYYRYYNMLPQEVGAIKRLNSLQAVGEFTDRFLKALNREIGRLGEELSAAGEDPYLEYLIRGIFVVGEQFRAAMEYENVINPLQYTIYVEEYFLAMDRVEEGYSFAASLDDDTGGIDNRLQLVKVLGWTGQYALGLEYAQRLYREKPESVPLLTEMAWMARTVGRYDLAETALEQLVRVEPDNNEHQEQLGAVYMESGKSSKAIEIFRTLARKLDNWLKYAHDMLRAALFSSDTKLMAEVVAETETVQNSNADYLRTRAEVLLNIDKPLEAYQTLKRVINGLDAGVADYERLVDTAIATRDYKLVAETVDLALKFSPGNVALMRKGAEAWREAGEPAKSYRLYRQVVEKEGLEEDVLNMLLAASDTQDLKLAREAAKYAVALDGSNVKVIAQAGEIMLWLNSPKDAYPYYRKAAVLTGGERDYVMTLVQVASYTGERDIFRDAAETAMRLRPHDEQVAMLAAAVWAAAGDGDKAGKLIARFADGDGRNLDMLLKWAEFADSSGLTEEAYRIYDRLYSLGYKKKQIRKDLARLAGWTDRPAVAAGIYGEMSDEEPRNFQLAMQAATAFTDAGEYKRAVGYYERALSLKPSDIELKLKLAETYGFAGMNAERIKLYTELWREGHLPESGRIELARAYIDAREAGPALDILEPYTRLEKLPRFEGFLLASALQLAGRGAEASAIYKRLGREYSTDEILLSRLGAEALFNNDQDDAYSLFEAALKVNRDNHTALKGLGIIFSERSEYKRAIAKFRHYLRLVPDDAEARYQLGEIYNFLGRDSDALMQYRLAERAIRKQGGKKLLKSNTGKLER
ncbi:tetratricopeptide repeat protein [Maridesulfovibrio sp. FT414]|uniref:tetratricopeptide repeat protein n=1 Tax=Maridesulfovibrio sp. FT414 TaxID=2979469 RepID=UPI003D80631C